MGRKRKLENATRTNDTQKVRKISDFLTNKQTVESEVCNVITVNEHASCSFPRTTITACRNFRDEWKYNRTWLVYDAKTSCMYCTVCKAANVTNSFTTGCSVMKSENVKNHEKAKGNIDFLVLYSLHKTPCFPLNNYYNGTRMERELSFLYSRLNTGRKIASLNGSLLFCKFLFK